MCIIYKDKNIQKNARYPLKKTSLERQSEMDTDIRETEKRWTVLRRARSTSQKVSPAGYTLTVTAQ